MQHNNEALSAPAGPSIDEPSPPGGEKTTGRSRAAKWAVVTVVAVLALVAAGLCVVYLQALGDRDDARQALSDTESALTETEAALADLEDEVEAAEAQNDEVTGQLAVAEQGTNDFLIAIFTEETAIDDATADCMATSLYEARPAILSELAVARAGGESALLSVDLAVSEAAESCGTTSEDLFGSAAPPEQPDAAVTAVDALRAECIAGSATACDALLAFAEPFSEEETLSLTCGGRFDIEDAPLMCEGNM